MGRSAILLPERWQKVVELVQAQGYASVGQIAQALSISLPTVRRDLARMHERGLVQRTRGGAEPAPGVRTHLTIAESRKVHPEEKEDIGRVAAEMIGSGECLMMDGGFTTYQVARHIRAKDVTVVTNSIDVVQALIERTDVLLLLIGGEVLRASASNVGAFAQRQLRDLTAEKACLGANAICPKNGLSSALQRTAEVKKAMIERTREVIVVADHSKLGRSALCGVAPITAISSLVTDAKADTGLLNEFRAAGVNVIVAPCEHATSTDDGSKHGEAG